MWRAASRVGCRVREDICAVSVGERGFGGGRARVAVLRRWVETDWKVGDVLLGILGERVVVFLFGFVSVL